MATSAVPRQGGGILAPEEPPERDPRFYSLKHEVILADLPDDMQLKIVEISKEAVEKYILFPTQKPASSREDEKHDRDKELKLLEREVERTAMREVAHMIKEKVEKAYGPCWHVIFGRNFAVYVTYEQMNFFQFSLDGANVCVWKHGA